MIVVGEAYRVLQDDDKKARVLEVLEEATHTGEQLLQEMKKKAKAAGRSVIEEDDPLKVGVFIMVDVDQVMSIHHSLIFLCTYPSRMALARSSWFSILVLSA